VFDGDAHIFACLVVPGDLFGRGDVAEGHEVEAAVAVVLDSGVRVAGVVDAAGGFVEVDVGVPADLKGMDCSLRHHLDDAADDNQVAWSDGVDRDDHPAFAGMRFDPYGGGGHV
jgi:hypothetical protein